MTNDDWQNCVGSLGAAPFLPPFPDPKPYGNPYYKRKDSLYADLEHHHSMLDSASTPDSVKINILYDALKRLENETIAHKSSIQSQLNFTIAKLTQLEVENEELKKTVADLVQSRYFD